jgi:hypothetical protein
VQAHRLKPAVGERSPHSGSRRRMLPEPPPGDSSRALWSSRVPSGDHHAGQARPAAPAAVAPGQRGQPCPRGGALVGAPWRVRRTAVAPPRDSRNAHPGMQSRPMELTSAKRRPSRGASTTSRPKAPHEARVAAATRPTPDSSDAHPVIAVAPHGAPEAPSATITEGQHDHLVAPHPRRRRPRRARL